MKNKILIWIFHRVAPWYAKEIATLVTKLPHEKCCASNTGPYQCDCAKRDLRRHCLALHEYHGSILATDELKEMENRN